MRKDGMFLSQNGEVSLGEFLRNPVEPFRNGWSPPVSINVFGKKRLVFFEREDDDRGTYWICETSLEGMSCQPENYLLLYLKMSPVLHDCLVGLSFCSKKEFKFGQSRPGWDGIPRTEILEFGEGTKEADLAVWSQGKQSGVFGWPKTYAEAFLNTCIDASQFGRRRPLWWQTFESLKKNLHSLLDKLEPENGSIKNAARCVEIISKTVLFEDRKTDTFLSATQLAYLNKPWLTDRISLSALAAFCMSTGRLPFPSEIDRGTGMDEERVR